MHRSLNIALLNSASNYKFDIFYELLIKQKNFVYNAFNKYLKFTINEKY